MKIREKNLNIVWKDPRSRKNYIIGELTKTSDGYKFRYLNDAKEAENRGFHLFLPFDDLNKTYESIDLFPIFASRLPDPKRRDIESILIKYGMDSFDEFELLKQGAELPIDTIKFVEPIDQIDGKFYKEFTVEGERHYLPCNGNDCEENYALDVPLQFIREPENKYDTHAVKVVDCKNNTVGYVPRYYSEKIANAMDEGKNFNVSVNSFNKDKNCSDCLKIAVSLK